MVSNEKLVLLYKETTDSRNKNIVFSKLYGNLEKGARKICYHYCRLLANFCQEDFFEECLQEAQVCLLKCIASFKSNRNTKFITFYFKSLQNHIQNIFTDKFKKNSVEFANNPIIEWKDFDFESRVTDQIDRKALREFFDKIIDKVNFSKPSHKAIFLDYIGFNEDKNTDETFSSLSRKYNLTRMAVGKICNKYLEIIRNELTITGQIDKLREF